ncbi:MAG TPA: hypothetical protein VKM72_11770 [Thermoanaerobaculia bacterium]|nr:hypothetical protein [Thermoanaerobaculia bacterium]
MLLALDADEPRATEAILAIEVNPVLPLAGAAVELGAGVLPDLAKQGQDEIFEVVVPLGRRDFLAGRAHAGPLMGCVPGNTKIIAEGGLGLAPLGAPASLPAHALRDHGGRHGLRSTGLRSSPSKKVGPSAHFLDDAGKDAGAPSGRKTKIAANHESAERREGEGYQLT